VKERPDFCSHDFSKDRSRVPCSLFPDHCIITEQLKVCARCTYCVRLLSRSGNAGLCTQYLGAARPADAAALQAPAHQYEQPLTTTHSRPKTVHRPWPPRRDVKQQAGLFLDIACTTLQRAVSCLAPPDLDQPLTALDIVDTRASV
jgi:hypothetical protein